jgi:hypothetical protein
MILDYKKMSKLHICGNQQHLYFYTFILMPLFFNDKMVIMDDGDALMTIFYYYYYCCCCLLFPQY